MRKNFERYAKYAIRKMYLFRFHQIHKEQATKILQRIEREKGKLAPILVKKCNEYANDVLGGQHYAVWLYVYSALNRSFKSGWMPDNFYGEIVVPQLKGRYGDISALKPLNLAVFHDSSFPDLASHVNGLFFDNEYNIVSESHLKDKIFNKTERVVFKIDNSLQGLGVYFFDSGSFDISKIKELGNGLFQSYVKQHPDLSKFQKSSVATLRMTTVLNDQGDASLRACYMRFGAAGESHVKSSSHIRVPIDIHDGAFHDIGYTFEWLETKTHPASNEKFAGNYVPKFADCVNLVCSLHKKVPFARCVGWDVTIDINDRIRIMEWNAGHNDIKFSEATQGPCFADMRWERLRSDPEIIFRF